MKQKKSQATLFIIIGIILLISIGFAIYLTSQLIAQPKTTSTEHAIKSYVQDCIKETAITAMKKIGDNGGYIDIKNPYRDFKINPDSTEGDALIISELGLYPIPYWWYMKTTNNCNNCYLTTDNMPLIPEIEEQVNNYVSKNLDKCLNNFSSFTKYQIKKGEPEIITEITKQDIKISAEYPLEFKTQKTTTKIKDFQTQIKIPFKKIYALAKEIIETEKTNAVIEERIMHMISAHSGAEYNKLPPISEITHDYYLIQWQKPIIEMQIKQILNSYMPLIRFSRTKNAHDIKTGNKYSEGFYNAMQIENLQEKYDLYADFSYNDWPIYLNINPAQLTGSSHKQTFEYNLMPPFQTNTYEFFYDITVPLLAQIRDPDALNGDGYTLNFAIETNIRDNKNHVEWNQGQGTLGSWTGEKVKTQTTTQERNQGKCIEEQGKYKCSINNKKYDTIQQCTEICYKTETKKEKIELLKKEFCSEKQKLSGEIKTKVRSGSEVIADAGISYTCGSYQTCNLGTTDKTGTLTSKLPICYNGIITAYKSGYNTQNKPLTTETGKSQTIEFNLDKEKEFTIEFKIKPIQTEQTNNQIKKTCCQQTKKPLTTQKAMISIEKIKQTSAETEFRQAAIIDKNSIIKLIPGKYKVNIQYIDETGIIIPEKCKKICIDYDISEEEYAKAAVTDISTFGYGGTKPEAECKEYKYIPEEKLIISPAPLGGAEFEWTITEENLQNSEHITFYVLQIPIPSCIDNECIYGYCNGLDEITKTKSYSEQFREFIEPKFS